VQLDRARRERGGEALDGDERGEAQRARVRQIQERHAHRRATAVSAEGRDRHRSGGAALRPVAPTLKNRDTPARRLQDVRERRMAKLLHRPDLRPTDFHGILSVSPQMRALFGVVERAARSCATVLVRGETGTGKELIAGALHALSPRSGKPFQAVNCATLTGELLASELFGHVKGAFTGAIRDRKGLFEVADGGTVFLDEVAELPLEIQARLLRVLQERAFTPLGSTDTKTVDVRLVSATNQALRRRVAQRKFREDLMYRIRVVPIFLPRLAEREGDVEALLWHFIDQFNARSKERGLGERLIDAVDAGAMEALLEYRWPGNVRELSNLVEYAFAVGEGAVFTVDDLTPELRGEPPPREGDGDDPRTLERARIVDALKRADGRKGKAADLLGMSRSTLWRKLREHRIA
jgi:two-component system response regulator AtoC